MLTKQWKNSPNNQIRISAWLYGSTCNCMNMAFLLHKTWLICFVHLVAWSQDIRGKKSHFSISSPWSRGRVWEQYAGGPRFKSGRGQPKIFTFFFLVNKDLNIFFRFKSVLSKGKGHLVKKKNKKKIYIQGRFEPGTSSLLFPHSTSRPRRIDDTDMEFLGKFILRTSNQVYKTNQSSFVK